VKTNTDYDTNLPLETIQKQPLAMSNFLFSDRPVATQTGLSAMILPFPKQDSRGALQPTLML
jgi:hypothetical protein